MKRHLQYLILFLTLLIPTIFLLNLSKTITNPKPIEESDAEDHAGRNAYFNFINTGDKSDSSWREEQRTIRTQRADRRIKNRSFSRSNSRSGSETFGSLTGQWIERGAKNQAGRILVTDILETTNRIVLGTQGGSVMVGPLSGDDYQIINDPIKLTCKSVHIFEHNGGERIVAVVGSGVYITDNNGTNWTKSLTGVTPVSATISRNNNKLYLLSSAGTLYESTNKGANFTSVGSVPSTSYARIWTARYGSSDIFILSGTTVYAYNGTSISTLGSIPSSATTYASRSITGDDTWNSTTLFAALDEGSVVVYRSTNGGVSWTKQGTTPVNNLFHENNRGFYSVNTSTIYIGKMECYRSTNAGVSWTKINGWSEYNNDPLNKLHADITEIRSYKDSSGTPFTFISSDGGTFISYNNTSYKNITMSGSRNSQYYGTQTRWDTPDIILAGAQDQGIQRSSTGQGVEIYDFDQYTSGDEGAFTSSDSGKSSWYTYVYGSLYYNSNTNTSSGKYCGEADANDEFMWMSPTIADPDNPKIVYIGGKYLHKVSYNGSSFTKSKLSSYNFASSITAIEISPVDNNHWYIATSAKKIYHSSNRGVNWTLVNSSIIGSHYLVGQDIIADPTTLGKIYICGNASTNQPAVLVSTDHGASFSALGTNTPMDETVYHMAISNDGKYIFGAASYNPYVYIFSENKWYDIMGTGAPDQQYYNVEYVPTISTARFSTYGRGIWDFKIGDVVVSPTLALSYPDGGGVYENGDTVGITWSTNQTDSVVLMVEKDGVVIDTLTKTENAATGNFEWIVGQNLSFSKKYKIVIYNVGSTLSDKSAANFTIIPEYFLLQQNHLSINSVDSEEPTNLATAAIDGDSTTFWHTEYSNTQPDFPHDIVLKSDTAVKLIALSYQPRQDASTNGNINEYKVEISDDGLNWTAVDSGSLTNDKSTKMIVFDSAIVASFIKLTAKSEVGGSFYASAAELNAYYLFTDQVVLANNGVFNKSIPYSARVTNNGRLMFSIPQNGIASISLVKLNGQRVFKQEINCRAGMNTIDLKNTGLAANFYILKINSSAGKLVKKIRVR